ncbi:hypothetical protein ANTRET_LOCUS7858 [Anthophora retusa]
MQFVENKKERAVFDVQSSNTLNKHHRNFSRNKERIQFYYFSFPTLSSLMRRLLSMCLRNPMKEKCRTYDVISLVST